MMHDRVYIMLDVVDGKAKQATEVLQESPGVLIVDVLEGSPDVIIVMEARNREQLAKLTVQALGSVEMLTEQVCLLPTRDGSNRIAIKLRPMR